MLVVCCLVVLLCFAACGADAGDAPPCTHCARLNCYLLLAIAPFRCSLVLAAVE